MTENEISKHIVECAIEVHRTLGGPGLLESVYVEPFCWELTQRGLLVERQVQVPIQYKGQQKEQSLRPLRPSVFALKDLTQRRKDARTQRDKKRILALFAPLRLCVNIEAYCD